MLQAAKAEAKAEAKAMLRQDGCRVAEDYVDQDINDLVLGLVHQVSKQVSQKKRMDNLLLVKNIVCY